jgi:O-succinylhomoserine sulfhydrylase
MSPFNAWVFLKGLETLELRMLAHARAAQSLAEWLTDQPGVERVYYPGLDSHPQHRLVGSQQRTGGGIVAFNVRGGRDAAWRVVDSTRILSITANLGDTKTTITHPATTTHGRLTPEERDRAGIGEGLLRIAVGLEEIDDIKEDLLRGLERI